MGTFTALDAAEIGALAETFALGSVLHFRPIAAGTINSNFAVETERGRFFIRVNEGKSQADVAWESQLVSALADAGVTTPRPLVSRDGRPYAPLRSDASKLASAFAWHAGQHLAAADVTEQHARAFGAALAGLHVAALGLPPAWRRRSIYDHEGLVARFATIERVDDPALAHAKAILREELEVAAQATAARAGATTGIIHGDLFRDNVLWDGEQISAILDFEQASGGSLAYDLAVCINDWCWTHGPELGLARALLAGYQRVRPLSKGDRVALPYEIRAAAMRFTITRITDVYLARVDNPEKDFRAFLARAESWRGPSLRELTESV